jgi:hypothetical protein
VIKRRSKPTEISPGTRFDHWQSEDLYVALETQVSETIHLLDSYHRCDAQQKEVVLERCDVKLRTAVQALASLRARCKR